MKEKSKKLSTESYKGVRDFYPEDMFVENYIFNIMQDTAESFGYNEYTASLLEPTALYEAKTGDEIVNEQTYTFTDRGGRSVTLRPEMTPTIARMVAARKHNLSFPLRWYSIPNVFRYERPQRGRLREHWQLNADIFGVNGIDAEVEIVSLAYHIMKNFGAKGENFEIRLSYAGMLQEFLIDEFGLNDTDVRALVRVIDKVGKITEADFTKEVSAILGDEGSAQLEILTSNKDELKQKLQKHKGFAYCKDVAEQLTNMGITDTTVSLEPFLTRGFDYYTGLIFEVFDTSEENNRSLFGGGRYDNLLDIFEAEGVPAVGFGMGDVTMRDYLETHNLLPEYETPTDLYICTLAKDKIPFARTLAERLRREGLNVAINVTDKKVGTQIQYAVKQSIPFIICLGDDELKKKVFMLKKLSTGEEKEVAEDDLVSLIFNSVT